MLILKERILHLTHRKYVRFWIFIAGMFISAFFFEEIVDDVFYDPQEGDMETIDFDRSIYQMISGFKSPAVTQMMIDFTALGSVSVNTVMILILLSVLFTYRDRKGIIYLTTVAAGAAVWPFVLKPVFARPRPDLVQHLVNVTDLSFPSGHAFGATSIYLGLAFFAAKYALNWRHEIFFYCMGFLLISLVGISRIYLGVHYPTDVLAGISGGIFWSSLVSAVYTLVTIRSRETVI